MQEAQTFITGQFGGCQVASASRKSGANEVEPKKEWSECLSRGYTCDFLLALTTRHPQNCFATEVNGGCTCSQVLQISAICCKKFICMNILQHCANNFVAKFDTGCTCNSLVLQSCNIRKKCYVASASKNVPRVAVASKNLRGFL